MALGIRRKKAASTRGRHERCVRRRHLRGPQPRRPQRPRDAAARRARARRGRRLARARQPARLGGAGQPRPREVAFQLRDWLFDHRTRSPTRCRPRPARSAARPRTEVVYLGDLINFYGKKADKFIGDETVPAHSPLMKAKKLKVTYRPFPRRRRHQPLELPPDPFPRRRDPRAPGGRRSRDQALRGHPARTLPDHRRLEEEIGGPDVLDVVNGAGETGSALVEEVDFVQFTGSDRTAQEGADQGGRDPDPRQRELGGKDPMIVLKSADVERAVNAATWGAFANTGQVCMSVERIYVEEPVYDEFVDRFKGGPDPEAGDRRPRLRLGPGRDDLPAADRDRRGARRRRERERRDGPHRRPAPRGRRRLVPADRLHRGRPLDGGDASTRASAPSSA